MFTDLKIVAFNANGIARQAYEVRKQLHDLKISDHVPRNISQTSYEVLHSKLWYLLDWQWRRAPRRECRCSWERHPSHTHPLPSSPVSRSNKDLHTDWKHWNDPFSCSQIRWDDTNFTELREDAKITILPKPCKDSKFSWNFRPIELLITICKLFEELILRTI
jgi:hypothetical protein